MSGSKTIATSETKIEALELQSSAYGGTLPVVYGVTRIPGNLIWYGGFTAIPHTESQSSGKGGGVTTTQTTYTYTAALVMALCEGPLGGAMVKTIWRGKNVYYGTTGLSQLGLSVASGAIGQAVWSTLTTSFPTQALGYSGVAHVRAAAYDLGSTATVDNHNFEVQAQYAYSISSTVPDVDMSAVALDLITNDRYGVQAFNAFGDLTRWSTYCKAANLLMSPAFTEQAAANEVLDKMAQLTNTAPFWSQGKLKFEPYGDTAITANGVTFYPNTTAVYDLDDRHFLDLDNPVLVERKPQADAYNHIRIEFRDRANGYNPAIAEAKDQANIDTYGLLSADVLEAHWICDAGIARNVAQYLLQRSLYVRNTYTIKLPWNFDLLEPMDIVTLTDPILPYSKYPVRITETGESEDGELQIVMEDFPDSVHTTTEYSTEPGLSFSHNYNDPPGPVLDPAIFEAPVELTQTGLEVYCTAKGSSASWGGCHVWVSTDGSNYRQIDTLYGPGRYGTITGPISAGVVNVDIGSATLVSGSTSDAQALATLSFIGGETPEYFAYELATLTGTGKYTLAGLVRGAYSTPSTDPHLTGNMFVRVDDAVAKSGPLSLDLIGTTIYFKFTSFNVYGGGEESLADVQEYAYTIAGYMASLPPSAPTGLAYVTEQYVTSVYCLQNPEPDVVGYRWSYGDDFASSTIIASVGGTTESLAALLPGDYTIWVCAVDFLGNVSAPASMTVGVNKAPAPSSVSAAFSGENMVLSWTPPPSSPFVVQEYDIRWGGTDFDSATEYTRTTSLQLTVKADWAGLRTWRVAAVVAPGSIGDNRDCDVTVVVPGPVGAARADVIDNNVNLYCTAPTIGTLPVDHYDIKKGADYASAVYVGSNGNSTFFTIFEQQSNTYTYWWVPVDTAGNSGTPVSVVATVSQPPDYVLRLNIDSDFSGTLSGAVLDGGSVYFPVVAETYQNHFSSRGWATPNDQLAAGFPMYIEPSGTSGYYEETIDYGTVITSTSVTVTPNINVPFGSVTTTVQISYKSASGDPWTDAPVGNQYLISSFRYVKVNVSVAATGGDDMAVMTALNIKLSAKNKNDGGSGTAVSTDVSGTPVSFTVAFLDITSLQVTAQGTTPVFAMYDFVDVPNPTSFSVYLFDKNGVRVSGPFTWTARGF